MRFERAAGLLTALTVLTVLTGGATVAGESESWTERIDVHGFISLGFLDSSENNYLAESSEGSFDYSEIGLNVSSQLTDGLRIGAQLFTRELGELGNYEIELDWAFLDWRARDWVGLRAGRVKLPYGLYNETADVDAVRTSVLLPQAVYRSDFRDFLVSFDGAAVYGNAPLGGAGSLDYQVFLGRNRFRSDGSVARAFSDSGYFVVDRVESRRTSGLAATWQTPLNGLRVGATRTRYDDSHLDVTTNPFFVTSFGFPAQTRVEVPRFDVEVFSVEYSNSRFSLAAEQAEWEGPFVNPVFGDTPHFGGHYVQGSVRVAPRVELGSYYSAYYPDLDDKDGALASPPSSGWQKDLALSVRVDLGRRWIVKLEYHDIDGTGQILNQDNPAGTSESWNLLAFKTSFAF